MISDHDGPARTFDRELPEAEILISQSYSPTCLTAEQIAAAHKLRLVITPREGAEDVDLDAAVGHDITVAEITHSTSISTAEYRVMLILSSVHNAIPSPAPGDRQARHIADYAQRAYDLEGMHVAVVGVGRVGLAVLRRLRPFDVRLHYTNPQRLPLATEDDVRLTYHPNAAEMVPVCDVVSIHSPLRGRLFDMNMIARMKRGAYLVNIAQSGVCDAEAVAHALETGQLSDYAADTELLRDRWAHVAGSTLSAQAAVCRRSP
jgi:formate dehydrogenase